MQIKKTVIWICWELTGFRFIWEKIYPPPANNSPDYKPPVTITLWLLATYVAFFGVASSRYENRVDIIENRANSIFSQLSTTAYKKALSRISRVQGMNCPRKPEILWPPSVFFSLIVDDRYEEMVIIMKETLEDWRLELSGINLEGVDLREARLRGANLQGAFPVGANLKEAVLLDANLKEAVLLDANLEGAGLVGANLQEADLLNANLQGANLEGANLEGANLEGANLTGANLTGANLFEADLTGVNLEGVLGLDKQTDLK